MSAIAKITANPTEIIGQYLAGHNQAQIAKSLGVTQQGLSYWLLANAEDEWKQAQIIVARQRKDVAEAELDRLLSEARTANKEKRAKLKLVLACAETALRAAQWDLERVQRRIYGQDVAQVAQAVQININLRRESATNTVDAEVVQDNKPE